MANAMKGSVCVVCLSHALTPDDISTISIEARRQEQGKVWGTKDSPVVDLIDWLYFTATPPLGVVGAHVVDVHFKILAVMGREFFQAVKSEQAYKWVELAVFQIVQEAREAGYGHVFIALGAYVKNATRHGESLLARLPRHIKDFVTFIHGDPGTVQLVIEMIEGAGYQPGFSVAIVGANGAIGEPVAKALAAFEPGKIVLVGKHGATVNDQQKNRQRLNELAEQIDLANGRVVVSQDVVDCRKEHCDLVIVATNEHTFPSMAVASGTLVLDVAAPNACWPDPGWHGRLVLLAGCGQFDATTLPGYFGTYQGEVLQRVIGGEGEFWGCMGEAVVSGMFNRRQHVVGHIITADDIAWDAEHFRLVGFRPQQPNMFGQRYTSDDVRRFVRFGIFPSVGALTTLPATGST